MVYNYKEVNTDDSNWISNCGLWCIKGRNQRPKCRNPWPMKSHSLYNWPMNALWSLMLAISPGTFSKMSVSFLATKCTQTALKGTQRVHEIWSWNGYLWDCLPFSKRPRKKIWHFSFYYMGAKHVSSIKVGLELVLQIGSRIWIQRIQTEVNRLLTRKLSYWK